MEYKLYNYRFKDGKVYRVDQRKTFTHRQIKVNVDEQKKPSDADYMRCLEMLLDFRAVRPPRNGTSLHKVIPKFNTLGELVKWRTEMISKAFKS